MGNNNKKSAYEFFIQHDRPEEFAKDPLVFYDAQKVKEYAESKALMRIQEKITRRALEISTIEAPARVLDVGMGSGFSSTYLFMKKYQTVGIDLNRLFLNHYNIQELNPIHADMRKFGFRPNSFELIISISAVQWLLAERKRPRRLRYLTQFAQICAEILCLHGRIVFQFYPKSDESMHELGSAFKNTGKFQGSFVIDNPENPKKRKIYLSLEKIAN